MADERADPPPGAATVIAPGDAVEQPPSGPTPAEPREPPRRSTRGWVLRLIAQIGLVLGIVGAVLFGVAAITISNSMGKPPHATTAPVAWATRQVQLSGEHAVVTGRITLEARSIPTDFRVGVNAGVPSIGDLAPGAALSGPVVRLEATAAGHAASCVAPCELGLASAFECAASSETGGCRMQIDVTVELLAPLDPSGGRVTLTISGGLTGRDAQALATPFTVVVSIDGGT